VRVKELGPALFEVGEEPGFVCEEVVVTTVESVFGSEAEVVF